ncbi:hypothetical protein F7984_09295 [Pradoshia sp. D12]|uniref:hypothetical protein n=1 Tax=Bacillaceae TaxID=186817 RepID=UPI0011205049|nr:MULTISPECIES: hypothetical protein [Bacillaceae]QFK71416.1 hypothetical protein F7984_09295 [Pradoshia sp. D12]TPF73211.1 hypothetical protein FHY44_05690 [Bacillus sp. D12]
MAMYELFLKIIDKLDSKQLEDIFRINKLRVKGFRINGPSSPTKTKTMKRILTEVSEEKLITLLKKAAETYTKEKNRDYSWALTSTIDEKMLTEKIENTSIGEVAFALIFGDKVSLLEKYLGDSQNDNIAFKKTEEKTNEEESLVKNLRSIITKLEEENKRLQDIAMKRRKAVLTQEHENKGLKKDLKLAKKENQRLENVLTKLREELRQFEIENEELGKLKLLFYGNDSYRKCIDSKVTTLDFLNYEYASGGIDEIEDYKNYHKLVVLSFTLNKKEEAKLIASKIFKYFGEIGNALFIDSLENFDQYIGRMEGYYDRNQMV